MDGKYAKYIKNFMKSFKINGDNIEIQTPENPKNKPLVYSLKQGTVAACNDKLDRQYEILTDNKEEIKKKLTINSKIATAIFAVIFILFLGLTLAAPASEVALGLTLKILATSAAGLTTISGVTLLVKNLSFENLINIINSYKENRKNIETAMQSDENITKYLNKNTHKLLSEKTKLVESGKSSEVLDIDFMDKLLDKKAKGRRELINLLNMYKATISLNREPIYIESTEERKESSKKRTKIKEESE